MNVYFNFEKVKKIPVIHMATNLQGTIDSFSQREASQNSSPQEFFFCENCIYLPQCEKRQAKKSFAHIASAVSVTFLRNLGCLKKCVRVHLGFDRYAHRGSRVNGVKYLLFLPIHF